LQSLLRAGWFGTWGRREAAKIYIVGAKKRGPDWDDVMPSLVPIKKTPEKYRGEPFRTKEPHEEERLVKKGDEQYWGVTGEAVR